MLPPPTDIPLWLAPLESAHVAARAHESCAVVSAAVSHLPGSRADAPAYATETVFRFTQLDDLMC